ncbi:MAG: hypothetical protein JWP35_55 [Caulobacter sp.]|nr:hypothetical protein [Caulobacter sp.]
MPRRQAQLRATSALYTKGQKIRSYLDQGVIASEGIVSPNAPDGER